MSGIREELLKTDKHNIKVRFFRGGTIEDMEDSIKPVLNLIILSFMSEPTTPRIRRPVIYLTNSYN